MSLTTAPDIEPIRGYRLIEPIGRGGFGEVWKAETADGSFKAIKFVRDDDRSNADDGCHRVEQELRAIQRIQAIRHPHLLSIERFEIVDDQLVIVSELADGNLFDRFEQSRGRGEPGIPRAELLQYLGEAADALDALNQQHQLQHLDIKPQNLFLIGDHVKVADFGLVKEFQNNSSAGGATPLYSAPETFAGTITPFCDQYSLAIVYEELLTGTRPFTGSNVQKLIWQHTQAPPNLAPLPRADRPAVARALAKKPENRFPSCLAFVNALRESSTSRPVARSAARVADDSARMPGLPNVAESIRRLEQRDGKPFRPDTPPTMLRVRQEDIQPLAIVDRASRTAPAEITGDGVLFPAVVIGLGHTGMMCLKRFRQSLCERFGGLSAVPNLRLLYIDTDPESADVAAEGGGGAGLHADEVLLTRLNRAGHYLKPRSNGRSLIEGWFDSQWLYRIPKDLAVASQRPLGRLAFGDFYSTITDRIEKLLEEVTNAEALSNADRHTSLGIRTNRPRVFVVAGLGGGTGGGMFIDVAYAVRNRLEFLGYQSRDVVGLLALPTSEGVGNVPSRAEVNGYAALTELMHYSRPETSHVCTFDARDASLVDSAPPFTRCMMHPIDGGPRAFSHLLERELVQPFGRLVDTERLQHRNTAGSPAQPAVSTFGIRVLSWPRREVVEYASRRLCLEVIKRWTSRDPSPIRPAVGAWIAQQWNDQPLDSQQLFSRLRQAATDIVGRPPAELFSEMAKPLSPRGWFGGQLDAKACFDFLAKLDSILGRPEDGSGQSTSGRLGNALLAIVDGISKDWGVRVDQLIVALIEQPDFRLAGAEEAISQFRGVLEHSHQEHSAIAGDLSEKAARAYFRMRALLGGYSRRAASEFAELARNYPTWCYESHLHRQIAGILQTLRTDLCEQLSEINFCRQRLEELGENFGVDTQISADSARYLLPSHCMTLEDAVSSLLSRVTASDMAELDRQMQKMVQSQFTALVHVCLSTSNLLGHLEPAMLKLANQFVADRVGASSAVELFFERYPSDQDASTAIADAFDAAEPCYTQDLGFRAVSEIDVVDVPTLAGRERLLGLIPVAIQPVQVKLSDGHENVGFYREAPNIAMTSLPSMRFAIREAYVAEIGDGRFTLHARNDVEAWLGASK